MYESFFQLSERPFVAAPRVDRYYPANSIEAARQMLTRAVERAEGPGLIVGPPGTGKSLLCQVLAEQFKATFRVALLHCARICTRRALLQAMLYELGMPYRERDEGELRLSLIDSLSADAAGGSGMLLLVDEAQTLPLRLLDEVRMITNLVRDGQPRVRVVVAGSAALEERLANPKLESFNQRVAARGYLEPMDAAETAQYIRAQIAACGGQADHVFRSEALSAVYQATGGIGRLVNQVCDHALVLACAGGTRQIGAAGIEEAWADLQQLPLPYASDPQPAQSAVDEAGSVEFGSLGDEEAIDTPDAPIADTGEEQPAIPFPAQLEGSADLTMQGDTSKPTRGTDEDFQPAGIIGPEVEIQFVGALDPFAEQFEEEELVIDHYASLDDAVLRNRPRVVNRGDSPLPSSGMSFAHQKETGQGDQATQQEAAMHAAEDTSFDAFSDPVYPPDTDAGMTDESSYSQSDHDSEHEILVIEDEPAAVPSKKPSVYRHQYSELFAKLKRG